MNYISKMFLPLLLVFSTIADINGQQAKHPAIELYLAGNFNAAIVSLKAAVQLKENEKNGELWNYLGLAYIKKDQYKDALKAIEKATKIEPTVSTYHSNLAFAYMLTGKESKARGEADRAIKLNPQNLDAYYIRGTANIRDAKIDAAEADAAKTIEINPTYSQGYLLLSNVYLAKLGKKVSSGSNPRAEILLLQKAKDILKTGIEKCKAKPNYKLIEDEYESISAFYKYFSSDKTAVTTPDAVPDHNVTALKIISKPHARYTDKARSNNIQGIIQVAVLFGANGKIEYILLLNRLGGGLDEQAIIAARKIQFEPVVRDGKPASVVKMIQYSFSIY